MAIYFDDLNLIGTTTAISPTVSQLEGESKLKYLAKTTLCLGLHNKKFVGGICLHQSVHSKDTEVFLHGYGSITKFSDGGTIIGPK